MFILILQIILVYIASCVFHEIGHSEIASYLGDNTAKHQGRSSFNPFKHLTLSGFRKVPIRLLNNNDLLLVSIAGILANLTLVFLAVLFVMVQEFRIFYIIIWVNVILVIVNVIPIRLNGITSDGYKIMKYVKNYLRG